MPVEQGRWLYDDQGLSPVKPVDEPDQDEAGGIGGTLRLHLALLIQRQLFAQKQICYRESSRRT
jgi:hypothetical protein